MNEVGIMFLVLIGTIALGVPIPIAVAIGTLVGYYLIDTPFIALAQAMYTGIEPIPLMTIPLFVFAGALMERGGLADRIVAIAQSMVGSYTGSLGIVAILGCTFFAALSGSGPATTAAIGAVMVPAMMRQQYDGAFGGAIVASGGALGSLIPPSNLMIIYGIVSDNSIPRLFLAGILPGILASLLLMICTWLIAKRRGYGAETHPFSWTRVGTSLWDGKWAIGAPVVILGGIYSGIFTPTEAASVAVFYAAIVGGLIYRELDWSKIVHCMKVTAMISGTVVIILGPAKAFGELMSLMDVPEMIGGFLKDFTSSQFLLLMIIALVLIITGMFLESIAQIILLTPLMLPIAVSTGVDPIVFGILMVIACEIGFLTPPVGANLFVAARLTNIGIDRISVAVLPFLITYAMVIVLISLFPEIVTALPNAFYGSGG
jgi:tripartite ATP-independent transporter DctM subunit